MMNQKTLMLVALALLCLSVFTYNRSVTRADRFERGQKFLSQLNADNIHGIEIVKGKVKVTLSKKDNVFIVKSKNDYPAKNEDINRLLNDMIQIDLDKPVGDDSKLAEELELVEGSDKTTAVTVFDEAQKPMVRFLVGKASDDGRGNYVQRLGSEDKQIYLTGKSAFFSSDENTYLDKDLLDVAEASIQQIQGTDFVFENKEGALKLAGLAPGKKESADAAQVKGALTGLTFENVFLADDPAVNSLPFAPVLTVNLKDNSSYQVNLAQASGKYYLRIQGNYDMSKLEGLSIAQDESKEQLKEKSDLLVRRDEVAKFNSFHGSWAYEVSEYTAKKFLKKAAELSEAEAAKTP